MKTVTLDCAEVATEADFWSLYLKSTYPEHAGSFGCNLDAFWDALAGGPGCPGECGLRFINTDSLKTFRDGDFYKALIKIASESKYVSIFVE